MAGKAILAEAPRDLGSGNKHRLQTIYTILSRYREMLTTGTGREDGKVAWVAGKGS